MRVQIRVKRWLVRVNQPGTAEWANYRVYAIDQWDARLMAFALYQCFPSDMVEMTEIHVNLALAHTKILGSI
jgi:hypothetical protein